METIQLNEIQLNENNNKNNSLNNFCCVCYETNNSFYNSENNSQNNSQNNIENNIENIQSNNLIQLTNCLHSICKLCLNNWIKNKMLSYSTGLIRCPNFTECNSNVHYNDLKDIMNINEFNKLEQNLFESMLLDNNNGNNNDGNNNILHKCQMNDECQFIFELFNENEKDNNCCNEIKIGDPIYIVDPSSYYIVPGNVIDILPDGNYEIELLRFQGYIRPLYVTERNHSAILRENVKHANSILYYGAQVRYQYSQANICRIQTIQMSQNQVTYLYDVIDSSNTKRYNIPHSDIYLYRNEYAQTLHGYYCPNCKKTGCVKCKMNHLSDVTCEQHLLDRKAYLENLTELKQFRHDYLADFLIRGENNNDLQLTAETLLQLDIRICRRCKQGVEKSSGCDKFMCRCGYKFCYQCGIENAQCKCTPSNHTYIDNTPRNL